MASGATLDPAPAARLSIPQAQRVVLDSFLLCQSALSPSDPLPAPSAIVVRQIPTRWTSTARPRCIQRARAARTTLSSCCCARARAPTCRWRTRSARGRCTAPPSLARRRACSGC
eukprot:6057738-Prymnesium_polylepis.1